MAHPVALQSHAVTSQTAAASLSAAPTVPPKVPAQTTPASFTAAPQRLAGQPMSFETNVGQSDPAVKFLSHAAGYTLFLTGPSAVLALPKASGSGPGTAASGEDVVTLNFAGANADAGVIGEDPLAYRTNYFLGDQAYTDIPNYARVRVDSVYQGISIEYYGNSSGSLEYDLVAAPNADLGQVRLQVSGIATQSIDPAGNLTLQTADGARLVQHAPSLYQQEPDGTRRPVSGQFALNADGTVGFTASGYDPARGLVVDPVVDFASFVGGSASNGAVAVAANGNGSTYIVENTTSTDYPIVGGIGGTPPSGGYPDVAVTRLSPDGSTALYSTFVGPYAPTTGSPSVHAMGAAIDPSGSIVIVGDTSSGYPVTPGALQTTMSGMMAGFVTRLSTSGDSLIYSSYLNYAHPTAVAFDGLGQAFVAGNTAGGSGGGLGGGGFHTTTGSFETTNSSLNAGFIVGVSDDGTSYLYSTYFNGTANVAVNGIAVDSSDNAYVTGWASDGLSGVFPVTSGAFQTSPNSNQNAFVMEMNTAGTSPVFSTFLGGTGYDAGTAITLDPATGNVVVAGTATSSDFPVTSGVVQASLTGSQNGFVTALASDGSAEVWSTYLGGSDTDTPMGIALTPDGQVTIAGTTSSSDYPQVHSLGISYAGPTSAFVTRLSSDATTITYSTFLGEGTAAGVAVDVYGQAYCAGSTTSSSFQTTSGSFQTTYSGTSDGFIVKLDVLRPPSITGISPDTGASSSDFITSSQNLTISGTAQPSVTVEVYQNDALICTTTSNTSGSWSFDDSATTLAEGSYAFTADSVSGSLVSLLSKTQVVTIDNTAPTVTLTVPDAPTSLTPVVHVQASDIGGLDPTATVTLDVDLNSDSNFTDPGETGYATGNLVNGSVDIPVSLASVASYPMRARVTDQAGNEGSSATPTMTMYASGSWTLQSAGVLTAAGDSERELQMGDTQYSYPLDLDQSPGTANSLNPALLYNSDLVSVTPIVQAVVQAPNSGSLPSSITATLTINGTAQTPVSFSTSGFSPGDSMVLAVQSTSTLSSTSRYDWALSISIPGHGTLSASGYSFGVVENNSPFGAGWTFSNLNQLIPIAASGSDPAGQLWVYGDGTWRFFQGTSGTLTSPADDQGSLVLNTGGSFTYTATDNSKVDFNSSGQQTDYLSPDALTSMTYGYNGSGQVTGLTALDGAVTTFTYASGVCSTIAGPGSRTWTMTMSAGDLTQIQDPASYSQEFTYASHRMTDATQGTLAKHWAYNSAGLLTTYRWGNSYSPSLTATVSARSRGLSGLAGLAHDANASSTDALTNKTVLTLDQRGRTLKEIDAESAVSSWQRDAAGQVTSYRDPNGNVTSYTRDSKEFVTTETLPDTNSLVFTYDSTFHNVTTATDENAHTTTYGHDSLGHLTSVTDAASEVTSYTISATTGLVTSVEDPSGRYTTYAYDTSRRVTNVTTQLGATAYTYTAQGEVYTMIDPRSLGTAYFYDLNGRMTGEVTPDGMTQSWSYNAAGLLSSYTDQVVTVTTTVYDTFGRGLTAAVQQGASGIVLRTTTYGYDGAGRQTRITDANTGTTTETLDSMGRAIKTTDPDGHATQNIYDLDGNVIVSTDANSKCTTYFYNSRNWLTQTRNPLGQSAYETYDAHGNVTQRQDEAGDIITTTYDAVNRESAQTVNVSSGVNDVTQYTYWPDGQVKTVTDPRGYVTSTTYDYSDAQITTTAAAGTTLAQTTIESLNPDGAVSANQDALSHTTAFTLNNVNQTTATTDPLSHTVTTTLNATGNATAVTDPRSHTTSYSLDAFGGNTKTTDATDNAISNNLDPLGRVVSTTGGASGASTINYDPAGNNTWTQDGIAAVKSMQFDADNRMISLTDAKGNVTRWQYDAGGNKIKETEPDGTSTRTWAYDAANRVSLYTDELGRSIAYTYYNNSQLQTEVWKNAAGTTVNTLTYTYDADGNILTAGDNNGTYAYTYDYLDRLSTQHDIWSITLTLGYDAANNVTSVVDSLGGTVTNTYDNANRITEKQFTDGTPSHALSVGYSYDAADELTLLARYSGATENTLIGKTAYGYDDAGRTTSIAHETGGGSNLDVLVYTYNANGQVATAASSAASTTSTYGYDNAGEVTSEVSTTTGTHTYKYDAEGNRNSTGYTTAKENEVTADPNWTYSYDAAGEMTQKVSKGSAGVWLYGYDNATRLVEADHKPSSTGSIDETVTYKYDVLNNRIGQTVNHIGGSTTTTDFAYDPMANCWADLTDTVAHALIARRLYNDAVDVLLARIDSAGVAWYGGDLLNSVRDLIGSGGVLLDHREYDVWGTKTSETAPSYGDRYGWTGREFHVETNLQYNRARWYDQSTGRWQSQDPLGFYAGDSNLYRYAANSPQEGTDPAGTMLIAGSETAARDVVALLRQYGAVNVDYAQIPGSNTQYYVHTDARDMDALFKYADTLYPGVFADPKPRNWVHLAEQRNWLLMSLGVCGEGLARKDNVFLQTEHPRFDTPGGAAWAKRLRARFLDGVTLPPLKLDFGGEGRYGIPTRDPVVLNVNITARRGGTIIPHFFYADVAHETPFLGESVQFIYAENLTPVSPRRYIPEAHRLLTATGQLKIYSTQIGWDRSIGLVARSNFREVDYIGNYLQDEGLDGVGYLCTQRR
jgi:RHS repeat-associated protein